MGRITAGSLLLTLVACGGGGGGTPDATAPDAAPPNVDLAVPCSDAMSAVYTLPSGLPAYDTSHRGDVFHCSRDRWLDAAGLDAAARADGYTGPTLTSGATIYRIAFRTERATPAGGGTPAEGHSAAFVLVPDHPRATSALVVYVHPSVGINENCAITKGDVGATDSGTATIMSALYGFAGGGFMVIAPDAAGFGFGDAPAFADSEDIAKSTLDATFAANKLLTGGAPHEVVIAGHSIGGHGVLSTDHWAKSYGVDGEIVGVLAFAPFWVSNLAWGALMSPAPGVSTSTATGGAWLLEYQLDYFYSHGELLDGAGHGIDLIQPAKQAGLKTLVTTKCLDDVAAGLASFGTYANDYFDTTDANALASCGFNGTCDTPPADVWGPRFLADRPAIDTAGPPIRLYFGGTDTTITPGFAQCAIDKVNADLAAATGATTHVDFCYDAQAAHRGVPPRDVGDANAWIGALVDGTTLPTCTPFPTNTCPSEPPNQF